MYERTETIRYITPITFQLTSFLSLSLITGMPVKEGEGKPCPRPLFALPRRKKLHETGDITEVTSHRDAGRGSSSAY